jgi:hypothetical protein
MTLNQSFRLGSNVLLAILPICLLLPAVGLAESPHSVISIKASNPVLHGLEVKTPLDSERRWVNLRGPELYSFPDVVENDIFPSYLTWYQIRKPKSEPVKEVVLADAFSGGKSFRVMLGAPAYYLIPAQTIQDGPPREIPENLNHFIAFRIANVDSVELPEPTPGKPAFVCVPAEEWHHADHSPIKAATKWFMVYEVDSQPSARKVTAIDQFGLNGLTAGKTQFIYVNAVRKE